MWETGEEGRREEVSTGQEGKRSGTVFDSFFGSCLGLVWASGCGVLALDVGGQRVKRGNGVSMAGCWICAAL